jgi:hypothetical protein
VSYKGIDLTDGYQLMLADNPPRPVESEYAAYGGGDLYFKVVNFLEESSIGTDNGKLVLLNNAQKGSLETCRTETRRPCRMPPDLGPGRHGPGPLVTEDPTYRSPVLPAPAPGTFASPVTDYPAAIETVAEALALLDENGDFDTARDDDPNWSIHAEGRAVRAPRDFLDALIHATPAQAGLSRATRAGVPPPLDGLADRTVGTSLARPRSPWATDSVLRRHVDLSQARPLAPAGLLTTQGRR